MIIQDIEIVKVLEILNSSERWKVAREACIKLDYQLNDFCFFMIQNLMLKFRIR